MKRGAIVLILPVMLLLSACTLWREHAISNWKDATGGEGLERSFWKDVKAKNWDELQRHIAANFVSATPAGRFDRAAELERLKNIVLDDYTLSDFQVELSANSVVVTYTAELRGSVNGQPLPPGPLRMLSVWQQQKSGWMRIAHSVIGPAANASR